MFSFGEVFDSSMIEQGVGKFNPVILPNTYRFWQDLFELGYPFSVVVFISFSFSSCADSLMIERGVGKFNPVNPPEYLT